MILSITRSPLRLFDEVGTGAFLSRFSNDLGILDSLFSTILIYLLEDIATEVVMLFNLISINLLYIISLILCFSVIMWFFKWSLDGMIKLKELALQEKNQIFSNFMEAIMGLTAIRTLNHASLTTHLFAQTLNKAFKTDNAYYQFEGLFIVFLS
jgi:ABC-type multidrug transport system fused ATPase/permease subunit